MKVYWSCPKCEHEHEVRVVIDEEDDLPEACNNCAAPVPDKAHEDVHCWAVEKASERPDHD